MNEQLIHEVLLKVAQNSKYTEVELAHIKLQQENVFINYFLERETAKALDNLKVEDEVLEKIFEENKDKFKIEPKIKMDTIFLKDGKKAQELLETVTVDNFDEMKKENDERENEVVNNEFITLSALIPAMKNVVEKIEENGIVKTIVFVDGGCHIVNIKDRELEREPSFEEAHDFILNEFKKSIYGDVYNKIIEEVLNHKEENVKEEESK